MSSEKHDMSLQRNDTACPDGDAAAARASVRLRTAEPAKLPVRCVWTDHLDPQHRHCQARVPACAIASAWQRELALGRTRGGFFHFVWRGRVWLAYGLPDGSIRGVYCPAHRAEREERLGYDSELAAPDQPAISLAAAG